MSQIDSFLLLAPAILLLAVLAAMMALVIQFDRLRWVGAKDFLSRFWSEDRRDVLHLEKQNGFLFFILRIMDWSEFLLRFSWVVVIPVLFADVLAGVVVGLILSVAFFLRSSCLIRLAAKQVKKFTLPFDFDGYGVYAQSAADWRAFGDGLKKPLIVSGICTLGFGYVLFVLLEG